MNLVNINTISDAVSELLTDYNILIDNWPPNRDLYLEAAWRKYYNAYTKIRSKLSCFIPAVNPNGPVDVTFLNITPPPLLDWQSFKEKVESGIIPSLHRLNMEADSPAEGAKNFYQFWFNFFSVTLEFESMIYGDSNHTATFVPSYDISDVSLTPAPFMNSSIMTTIKNILDSIITLNPLQNKITIKMGDDIVFSRFSECFLNRNSISYILTGIDLYEGVKDPCFYYIMVNSVFSQFFNNVNFPLFTGKIINLVNISSGTNIIPQTTNNNAVMSYLGIT